ncbi:hypothetical protein LTR59_016781 [Friedmanniomyces endolithicus]|nr:hypothetical protein LTR94_020466 [Friedmanniomyces endolithicus]KAK0769876.1 hypothetical protein LTR59_016781 [Friedmanniomyces endolithicus]KAK0771099.1 hypothetical protein LTR75_017752 [Friedmanniomyces endolithicus]KAK0772827.1 hypothetical protein LTR38_016774 [Friedmanniomyces endolithicus]
METFRGSGGVWSSGSQANCPGDARDEYFIVVGALVSGEDQKPRRHLGVLLFDASASTTPLSPAPALGADIVRYTMGLSQANIDENVEESHGGLTEEQAQTQCESSFDTTQVGASEAHVHPHSGPLEHGSGGSTSPFIQTRDELVTPGLQSGSVPATGLGQRGRHNVGTKWVPDNLLAGMRTARSWERNLMAGRPEAC